MFYVHMVIRDYDADREFHHCSGGRGPWFLFGGGRCTLAFALCSSLIAPGRRVRA